MLPNEYPHTLQLGFLSANEVPDNEIKVTNAAIIRPSVIGFEFFIVLFLTIRCLSWLANAFALHLLIAAGSDNRTKKKKKFGSSQTSSFTAFEKRIPEIWRACLVL